MSPISNSTSKAAAQKGEVKHSSSSLLSLITCFISCFIMAVSCICPSTVEATATAAATASVTSTASAAAVAMTAKVATVGNGSENSSTTIDSQGSSRLGVLSISDVGGNGKGNALSWDHAVDLNEDFRILWTIINQDITFEVQARTLGYVGFGFSPDGNLAGSDIAIGWVDKGQTYFQVS